MTAKKIVDEFSDKKVSRQRRYELRHPDKAKTWHKKYEQSEKGKEKRREYYKRKKETDE